MRRGINKVTLVGNVGDDPKVNQINDDLKVARFPLATNELYLDKEGNHVQKTQWHTIVVWNKIAGVIEEYVKKGRSFICGDKDPLNYTISGTYSKPTIL